MGEAVRLPSKPPRFKRLRYACALVLLGLANLLHLFWAVSIGLAKLAETTADDLESGI